jgi:hypothetical protein
MDLTTAALAAATNPAENVRIAGVPVFKANEHATEGDLYAIAEKQRQNKERFGVLPVICFGHRQRDPQYPETAQPEVIGYGDNARVGKFGPAGETALLMDLYIRRDMAEEAKRYPFRSSEYYPAAKEITGIALLRRDPKLDLGILAFQRQGQRGIAGPVMFHDEVRAMMPGLYPSDPAAPPQAYPEPPPCPRDVRPNDWQQQWQEFVKQAVPCLKALIQHQQTNGASNVAQQYSRPTEPIRSSARAWRPPDASELVTGLGVSEDSAYARDAGLAYDYQRATGADYDDAAKAVSRSPKQRRHLTTEADLERFQEYVRKNPGTDFNRAETAVLYGALPGHSNEELYHPERVNPDQTTEAALGRAKEIKDTWIDADGVVRPVSRMLPPGPRVVAQGTGGCKALVDHLQTMLGINQAESWAVVQFAGANNVRVWAALQATLPGVARLLSPETADELQQIGVQATNPQPNPGR